MTEHLRASSLGSQPQLWSAGPIVFYAPGAAILAVDPQAPDDAVLLTSARLDPPFDAQDAHTDGLPSDAQRVQSAYRNRGERAPEFLFGDWMFAAWHPRERRLVVARDHVGTSAVYYYTDPRWFAFASDVTALAALPFVPKVIDQAWLVESLLGWTDPRWARTSLAGVRQLPPAHQLTVTAARPRVRRYWHPADVEATHGGSIADSAAQLREVLTAAVASRLPPAGDVASQLSGGLDSGSVTVLAAGLLAPQGRSLHAFTASARGPHEQYFDGDTLVDEWPLAAATAASAPNIVQRRVSGEAFTPVAAIRRWLELGGRPIRNPSNLAWILEISDSTRAAGCDRLLTGNLGNLTISWAGRREEKLSPAAALRRGVATRLPAGLQSRLKNLYRRGWYRDSAIRPRLLHLADVAEMLAEQRQVPLEPVARRHRNLLQATAGAAILGFQGRAQGIQILDATGDMRVVELTLAVPPEHFVDPATGMRRWLIREATRDLLPEQVRLNRRIARQGIDFVPRLRASASEVTDALHEIASGPAADYLDVRYLARSWDFIQAHDDPASYIRAARVLGRGLMTGLYVNAIEG